MNTHHILGLVAYTGKDTKLMLNQGKSHYKSSRTERIMNLIMLVQVLVLAVLILFEGLLAFYFT